MLFGRYRTEIGKVGYAVKIEIGRGSGLAHRGIDVKIAAGIDAPGLQMLAEDDDGPLGKIDKRALDSVFGLTMQTGAQDRALRGHARSIAEEIDKDNGFGQADMKLRALGFRALYGFRALCPAMPVRRCQDRGFQIDAQIIPQPGRIIGDGGGRRRPF